MADTPTGLAGEALDSYAAWMQHQPLAARTRPSYLAQVSQCLRWLGTLENAEELLPDPSVRIGWGPGPAPRNSASKQTVSGWPGRSVTTRGGCSPNGSWLQERSNRRSPRSTTSISAEDSPWPPTPNLSPVRRPKHCARNRSRPYAGQRPPCLSATERSCSPSYTPGSAGRNSPLSKSAMWPPPAGKGDLTVRRGKGNRSRTVPLNAECRKAVEAWKADRARWPIRADSDRGAFWLSRLGNRLSSRAIADVVTNAGRAAGIPNLTAHTLRHAFVSRLVRNGTDPFIVADLAGHARLKTALLYSLSTESDRHTAVEALSPCR